MTWISYAERKPKAEPVRQLWVIWADVKNTPYGWIWSNWGHASKSITHWAEIEGPGEKSKLPHSTDARDWAKEFVEIVKENPSIPSDAETMTTWFANAIMAGVDEAERRHRAKAKIEGPGDLAPVSPQAKSDPPPPDPFEEWFSSEEAQNLRYLNKKERDRQTWEAAMKHSANINQQYKEWKQP